MSRIFGLLVISALSLFSFSLPKGIFDSNITITPESSYEIFDLMRNAKKKFRKGKIDESMPLFIQTLEKALENNPYKNIDQFDYLYAHHGILTALKAKEKQEETYIILAKKILSYLDNATVKGIWEEGELGKMQMLMYKRVGNHLATLLYVASKRKDKEKLQEALDVIEKAEAYIRQDRDMYIKETKEKITNAIAGNPPLLGDKKLFPDDKKDDKKKDDKKIPQK